MSQWTHVGGYIRIDGIIMPPITFNLYESKIKDAFGKIIDYDHMGEETIIPCGSEGSLRYQIIRQCGDDDSCLAALGVVIWGDLRSYDNVKAIFNWIVNATKQPYCNVIRQAVIQVEVESQGSYIIQAKRNKKGDIVWKKEKVK